MQKITFFRSPAPDGTEAATDYLSEIADSLDLTNQLAGINLESLMRDCVEYNLQLLKDTQGKGYDIILKDTGYLTGEWCGFTTARAYLNGGLPSNLKGFFEGVGGINCFVSYKDDAGKPLRMFYNGSPIILKEIHERMDCLRLEFSVQDVLDGNQSPMAGDIVLLDWHNDNNADHIQMVYSYNQENKNLVVIEGNGTSFVNTDQVMPPDTATKSDGLSQEDRLQIVQTEMGDTNWNRPAYGGTWIGLTAYNINEALANQTGSGVRCRIVKFVRPSAMDFLTLKNVIYDSPYHIYNK